MNASQEQCSACGHAAEECHCSGEAPHLDDLPQGHRIGDYVVEKRLGSGGMATVYAVRSEKFALESRLFALKIFTCREGNCNELRRKFINEAEILHAEKLGHKHLVKVHDLQRSGSHPYYVMDLVLDRDGNVSSLDRVRCDQKRLRKWFGQVCEVLYFIHSKNLIHRDIKPGNVLIDENDDIRLTDFGVAKILDEELRSKLLNGRTMVTGMSRDAPPVFGTRDYLPPEVLDDTEATPAWDIWATGKMFFEKLTGGTCDYSSTERFIVDSLRAVDESGFWVARLPKFLARDPSARTPDLLECTMCAAEASSPHSPMQSKLPKSLVVGGLAALGVVFLALFLHNSKRTAEDDSRSIECTRAEGLDTQDVHGVEDAQQGKDATAENSCEQGGRHLRIGDHSTDDLFASIPDLREMLALYPTCQWAYVEADVSPTDEWFTKVGLYVKTGVFINDKFDKEYLPKLEDALLALSGEKPIEDSAVSVFQELDLQKRRQMYEILEKRRHVLSPDIDIKDARGWWTHEHYPIVELAGVPYLFVGNPKASFWQRECPELNPIMLKDLDGSDMDYDFSDGSTVVVVCSWIHQSMEPMNAKIKKFSLGREQSIRFYKWAQKAVDVSGDFVYKLTRDAGNDSRGAKYTKVPMKYLANIKIGVLPRGLVFYVDALVGSTGAWAFFADRLPNSWVDEDFEKRFDRVVHAEISDGVYKDPTQEPELSVHPRHDDSDESDLSVDDTVQAGKNESLVSQDAEQDAGDLNVGKHFVVRCLAKTPRTILFGAGGLTGHEMEYQYDLSVDADWYFQKLVPIITNMVFETSKRRPEISRIEIAKPLGGTGIPYDIMTTEPAYADHIGWQILGLERNDSPSLLNRRVAGAVKNKNVAQLAVVISQTGENKMAREIACAIYSMSREQLKTIAEKLSAFEVKEPKVSYDVMLGGRLVDQREIDFGDLDLSSHSEMKSDEYGDVYVFTPWFRGGWTESIRFPISVNLKKYSHNAIEIKFHGAECRD